MTLPIVYKINLKEKLSLPFRIDKLAGNSRLNAQDIVTTWLKPRNALDADGGGSACGWTMHVDVFRLIIMMMVNNIEYNTLKLQVSRRVLGRFFDTHRILLLYWTVYKGVSKSTYVYTTVYPSRAYDMRDKLR